ncbi:hypothetical protein DASC09_019960 [Saccharomycopsis crataegensis]|uniref:JmjC domain-containing protein n=1 Tax=Saccharomycopsis crataegensis TaxID=43959 RepID=A0AAV5QJ09_9ASCO|nr:hypothetical protein DASC09_019960 [Saccharomycopsis crataegensis]
MSKEGKRSKNTGETSIVSKKQKVNTGLGDNYDGYKPLEDNEKIAEINIKDIDAQKFYEEYIKPRKPVVINGIITDLDISGLKSDTITKTLGRKNHEQYDVQVEKRVDGGFGSGFQRQTMAFDEFIAKVVNGETDGYLTTQYDDVYDEDLEDFPESGKEFSDDDEEEDEDVGDDGMGESEREKAMMEAIRNHHQQATPDDVVSEADSIDFNDLHDDFDDLGGEEEEEEVLDDCKGEPLYVSEAVERIYSLIQKPLTSLFEKDKLPIIPTILETLIPQQINIWAGSGKPNPGSLKIEIDETKKDFGLGRRIPGKGTSSGLHHDHANNLYIPVQGKKRFTIFPPSEAENLYTVGDINKIFNSGVIDYTPNERAPKWKPVRSDGAVIENPETIKDEDDDEEEVNKSKKLDPPSFCEVPPILLHSDELEEKEKVILRNFEKKHFPKLSNAKRITVELKSGQMLYLPTGWFHEVSSFGLTDESSDNMHIAVNYWFYPTDGNLFENPYLDSYWKTDFQRTQKAYSLYRQGKFELS